jgi:hypothetical protein
VLGRKEYILNLLKKNKQYSDDQKGYNEQILAAAAQGKKVTSWL